MSRDAPPDAIAAGRPSRPALDLGGPDGLPREMSVAHVVEIAREGRAVQLLSEDPEPGRQLEAAMRASAAWVAERIERLDEPDARPIYGISTGFGALAGRETFHSAYHARVLQRNLLVSHAAGTGAPLDEDVVRAAVLIRVRQLIGGHSGIRIEVVNRLIGILNHGLYPRVPSMGSLGASGDLAPMAHLALTVSEPPRPGRDDEPLPVDPYDPPVWVPVIQDDAQPTATCHITEDELGRRRWFEERPASEAMAVAGGRLELRAKEALALTNGATFSAALLALATADAARIFDHAELALAMSLEAARGFRDAFLPEMHAARGLRGQQVAARRVLEYTAGSTLLDSSDRNRDPQRVPPQDPYSLRCGPQVIGAGRDALAFITDTLRREVNAAVDNPLIFLDLPRSDKTVSGGNFHGAPIGYAADLLKVIATDCASISERRTYKLTDLHFRDRARSELALPMFLIQSEPGLEGLSSGLMIPQYTAASLVSACKTLGHPDSVDSISSSAGQEDHVSMSMNAARHAREVVRHVEAVIAIELMTAAQALTLRIEEGAGHPGAGARAALETVREVVEPLRFDRALHVDITAMQRLLRSGRLVAAARRAIDSESA